MRSWPFSLSINRFCRLPLKDGEIPVHELRAKAAGVRTAEELFLLFGELIPEIKKHDRNKGRYYRALSEFLAYRLLEFEQDYGAFVVAHYFQIMDHLFAPDYAVSEMDALESMLTINRSHVVAFSQFPANRRQARARFTWHPAIKEVLTGLDYLAKLYTIDQPKMGSGNRFKKFVLAFSKLAPTEAEALWQFRCGLFHSGTLYNISEKGVIYRFRTDFFDDGRVVFQPNRSLAFLEGERFHVNLGAFPRFYEDALMFLHDDMKTQVAKYAFSPEYLHWIRTHWSLSYLLSKEELANLTERMAAQGVSKAALDLSKHSQIVLVKKWDLILILDSFKRWMDRRILGLLKSQTGG